jgi:hypothetical protein
MIMNQPGARINAVYRMAILSALIFWCAVCGRADSAMRPFPDSVCDPKVVVSLGQHLIIVCLDRYKAGNDSCADITLRIQKPYNVDVRFNCTSDRQWHFDSVVSQDPMAQLPPMRVDVSADDAGILDSMSLVFGPPGDSTKVLLNARRNSEIHEPLPDTTPAPIGYVLQKTAYRCVDRAIVVYRTFIYPPGYMRREPVYNYPELSLFHYGGAIRMPTNGSVAERGYLIIYEHILHPKPLKYEEKPMKYIDDQKPKPPAKKKEGFIKIRPLP